MKIVKKSLLFFMLFLFFSPMIAMFVGAQHWKDEKTGKKTYLFFETHNLGEKNKNVAQTIVNWAKKLGAKVLSESLYTEMKQCPESVESLLPLIHHLCIKENVPVEDVDIRGAYEKKCRAISLSILIKRCEIAIDNFNALRKEIQQCDDPKEAKDYYKKLIAKTLKNPFFKLINNTIANLKKGKKKVNEKNLDDFYKKIGTDFVKQYLNVVKQSHDFVFRSENRKLLKNIDQNLTKLTGPIFRKILNNEFLHLLDIQAMRSIFDAHKKYGIVFLCAGSKHCAAISKLFEKLYSQVFIFKSKKHGLIKEIGDTDRTGSIFKIDVNKIFEK